jgi:hypothetical protein
MKRILLLLIVLCFSTSVYSQTKMFISKTGGTDSVWLSDVKSIYFKTYNSPIPSQGLMAWYPFNGNTNDESGNNHKTYPIGTTLTTDRFGNSNKALSFNGTSDYLVTDTTSSFVLKDSATMSVWINPTKAGDVIRIKSKSANDGFEIASSYVGQIDAWASIDLGLTDTSNSIGLNKWYHIVAVLKSKSLELYVNNVLVKNPTSVNTFSMSSPAFLMIGKHPLNSFSFFGGFIDDIRIYNRALSIGEIQSLYNEK